jgi:hypothetical protein
MFNGLLLSTPSYVIMFLGAAQIELLMVGGGGGGIQGAYKWSDTMHVCSPAFRLMCVTAVRVGPDVESPLSSNSHVSGTEGLLAEPEDKELYLMCLCEQQVTSVGGSKRKKGKEIFIGFLVSCNVIMFIALFYP